MLALGVLQYYYFYLPRFLQCLSLPRVDGTGLMMNENEWMRSPVLPSRPSPITHRWFHGVLCSKNSNLLLCIGLMSDVMRVTSSTHGMFHVSGIIIIPSWLWMRVWTEMAIAEELLPKTVNQRGEGYGWQWERKRSRCGPNCCTVHWQDKLSWGWRGSVLLAVLHGTAYPKTSNVVTEVRLKSVFRSWSLVCSIGSVLPWFAMPCSSFAKPFAVVVCLGFVWFPFWRLFSFSLLCRLCLLFTLQ